jgi:nucleoside-diphosphate-sugar epimerase
MHKPTVALLGGSGTMGHAAFKELWARRDQYEIVLLLRPSARNKALLLPYEQQAGIRPAPGPGVVKGKGLTIVWGDATRYADVEATLHGADWVLNAMAYISPQADYHPQMARAVNHQAIGHIVQAIQSQPGGAPWPRPVTACRPSTGAAWATRSSPPSLTTTR